MEKIKAFLESKIDKATGELHLDRTSTFALFRYLSGHAFMEMERENVRERGLLFEEQFCKIVKNWTEGVPPVL